VAYADIALFKIYRGMSASTSTAASADNTTINHCLTAAQGQIDRYTGRTFESSATSTRYFDALDDVSDDRRTLYLDEDLAVVTTITNGDAAVVASTSYVTRPVNSPPYHEIRIKASSNVGSWTYEDDAESAISVRGNWAYSTAAPDDIVQATLRLANYMYVQKDAGVFDVTAFPDAGAITIPQGIPRDVVELLRPYVRIR
jgi:hypothetical protein